MKRTVKTSRSSRSRKSKCSKRGDIFRRNPSLSVRSGIIRGTTDHPCYRYPGKDSSGELRPRRSTKLDCLPVDSTLVLSFPSVRDGRYDSSGFMVTRLTSGSELHTPQDLFSTLLISGHHYSSDVDLRF